jgi:undecaprenyl-diphosphatase
MPTLSIMPGHQQCVVVLWSWVCVPDSARPYYARVAPATGASAEGVRYNVDARQPGDYRGAVILGLVQGVGEFLPISSSGHLIVVPWLGGFEDSELNSLAYDVALHLGTTSTLMICFWRDWLRLVAAARSPRSSDGRLFWALVVASLPGAAAGYLVDELATTSLRSPIMVAGTLAGIGSLMYLVDRSVAPSRKLDSIAMRDACALGVAQAVALVPGVSRSGATMTMARALGFEADTAAYLSFMMAAPITAGAFVLKASELEPGDLSGPFVAGIVTSGLAGLASIRFLSRYLARPEAGLAPFVLYRFGMATLILLLYLWRRGRHVAP